MLRYSLAKLLIANHMLAHGPLTKVLRVRLVLWFFVLNFKPHNPNTKFKPHENKLSFLKLLVVWTTWFKPRTQMDPKTPLTGDLYTFSNTCFLPLIQFPDKFFFRTLLVFRENLTHAYKYICIYILILSIVISCVINPKVHKSIKLSVQTDLKLCTN